MNMTWRQFETYLDAFTWLDREGTKEGKADNQKDDLDAMKRDVRVKGVKYADAAAIKNRLKEKVAAVRNNPNRKRKIVRQRRLV